MIELFLSGLCFAIAGTKFREEGWTNYKMDDYMLICTYILCGVLFLFFLGVRLGGSSI